MKTLEEPVFAPLDAEACTMQLALLKSLHCCRPVVVDGKEEFIQVVHSRQSGGRIEMEVWLTGKPDPVAPELITIPKRTA